MFVPVSQEYVGCGALELLRDRSVLCEIPGRE